LAEDYLDKAVAIDPHNSDARAMAVRLKVMTPDQIVAHDSGDEDD
ncbi:MAG: hypothetical protein H7338_04640, partial [Candidatus Sericytochromatia bacterium]|nr:hypothetical protein [Candidatus Sericytochromatia bacterium]